MHPARLCAPQSTWHSGAGTGHWEGSCLESSRVCASLCRMRERATQNWSTGGWLLALGLVWLWTHLALASLQPPTPTGLGEVVGPWGGRFSRMPGKLDTTAPRSTAGRSLRQSKTHRCEGRPILTFPSMPEGVLQGEEPPGQGLSLASWPNSVVFLLGWLKPV